MRSSMRVHFFYLFTLFLSLLSLHRTCASPIPTDGTALFSVRRDGLVDTSTKNRDIIGVPHFGSRIAKRTPEKTYNYKKAEQAILVGNQKDEKDTVLRQGHYYAFTVKTPLKDKHIQLYQSIGKLPSDKNGNKAGYTKDYVDRLKLINDLKFKHIELVFGQVPQQGQSSLDFRGKTLHLIQGGIMEEHETFQDFEVWIEESDNVHWKDKSVVEFVREITKKEYDSMNEDRLQDAFFEGNEENHFSINRNNCDAFVQFVIRSLEKALHLGQ